MQNPFLDYAASHWGVHVKACPESRYLRDAKFPILQFLENPAWLASCGQALWPTLQTYIMPYTLNVQGWSSLPRDQDPLVPAVHLLAYFGLNLTAQEWLDKVDGRADCPSPSKFTALFLACRLGHVQMVHVLLARGADPRREFEDKIYCLGEATRHGEHAIVRELLGDKSAGELVRLGNKFGRHPLGEAIAKQDMNMVRAILDFVLKLDDGIELVLHQDNNGYGALHEAVSGNKTAIMEQLVQVPGGAALLRQQTREWRDTPLHLATLTAKLDSIRILIRLGADTAATQSQGRTPLHLAAELSESRYGAVVKLLLESGASPGVRDLDGSTALHAAVRYGRARHVEMLLDAKHGAILDIPDTSGRTALFTAVAEWRTKIARMLLSAGCDALVPDQHGHSAIYYAGASRNQGLIDAFMDHRHYHKKLLSSALKLGQLWHVDQLLGGSVNTWPTFDSGDTTILHKAAESGFVDVVKFILQRDKDGVLLNKANGDGQPPLLLAALAEDVKIMEVLIKAGANVDAQERLGETSLHLAARDDLPNVVEVLIKAGARLDITNRDGVTPHAKALACGSDDCAALLANAGG